MQKILLLSERFFAILQGDPTIDSTMKLAYMAITDKGKG
jgi:hypothetical protein